MQKTLKIGTRGSKLALTQTHMVRDALLAVHPELEIEIVEIKTSGDWNPKQGETRLSEAEGGKGLFAREIEQALLAGTIDCGVHSMKDMASLLPEGLVINHMLEREDPRDTLISNNSSNIDQLPQGAVVGTASLRRQAFLLARRPDLKIVPFRGNVPTRLEKLRGGQVNATILALAGLKRLGLQNEISCILSPEEMLPAAGQGAIGIETREGDTETQALFDSISHYPTVLCVQAERAALQVLDGSCRTPIGAYATLDGGNLSLRVAVASPDGRQIFEEAQATPAATTAAAETLGVSVGSALKDRLPEGFLE